MAMLEDHSWDLIWESLVDVENLPVSPALPDKETPELLEYIKMCGVYEPKLIKVYTYI